MGGLFRAIEASRSEGEALKAIAESRDEGGLCACDGSISVIESEKNQQQRDTNQQATKSVHEDAL